MERIVFSFGSARQLVLVKVNNFEGTKLVDIRKFYRDKITEELLPTKKGISLNHMQFENMLSGFSKNISEFNDFFGLQAKELDSYDLNISTFISGRKFKLEHENGKQTLSIDKSFASNFDDNSIHLLKKMIQIVNSCVTEVLEDPNDIESFLDYFNSKLNILVR